MHKKIRKECLVYQFSCYRYRENLNKIEGQTDSSPVDKYNFTWTTKGVRCYPVFQL